MMSQNHIRNPIEWSVDQVRNAGVAVGHTGQALRRPEDVAATDVPDVHRIGLSDLRDALAKGFEDFTASRSDVIFLCVFYPLAGLLLAWSVFN
jgi:uncharacterized membrane protein